jgi:hypothetical protein
MKLTRQRPRLNVLTLIMKARRLISICPHRPTDHGDASHAQNISTANSAVMESPWPVPGRCCLPSSMPAARMDEDETVLLLPTCVGAHARVKAIRCTTVLYAVGRSSRSRLQIVIHEHDAWMDYLLGSQIWTSRCSSIGHLHLAAPTTVKRDTAVNTVKRGTRLQLLHFFP